MMTFNATPASRHASATLVMSVRTRSRSPDFNAPMLITMSNSRAPSRIARRASIALISGGDAPNGNPITDATLTELPRSARAAGFTQAGFTQTDANPNARASLHNRSMSSAVASGSQQGVVDVAARSSGTDPCAPSRAAVTGAPPAPAGGVWP
jgi:hypothetical protein